MTRSRSVPPRASAMLEALRGLGYTTASALADIVDNSIAANASVIRIVFDWRGPSTRIAILDDGAGMGEDELEKAMRLGERSPLEARATSDLGRFGLGLKTASFSQARRLTVASRQNDSVNSFCWDLDILAAAKDDGWHLMEGLPTEADDLLAELDQSSSGTLVLWEALDRVVTKNFTKQDFLDLIDRVESHIAMVFHRYLEGPRPLLRITINGRPVSPWDPFATATWSSPVEPLPTEAGIVEAQGHVLAHRDRLSTQDYAIAGGPEGWTAQQGFYVYRNRRLLVPGNWLGLGGGRPWTKEEPYRLARIRLDIPNSADADWKIDIRKSIARPPVSIRYRITHLAEDTRERARRVFAHRGQVVAPVGSKPIAQAWRAEHLKTGMRYRIDEDHPAVKAVLEQASDLAPQIKAMLRVIEETLPVQRIWLDTAEAKETPQTGFSSSSLDEIVAVLDVMYRNLIGKKGLSPALAREQLLATEPFHQYPDLVRALPDEPKNTIERPT